MGHDVAEVSENLDAFEESGGSKSSFSAGSMDDLATGLMLFNVAVALIAAAILAIADVLAFLLVVAKFQREHIVTKL